jgi:hypothetical protein
MSNDVWAWLVLYFVFYFGPVSCVQRVCLFCSVLTGIVGNDFGPTGRYLVSTYLRHVDIYVRLGRYTLRTYIPELGLYVGFPPGSLL